MRLLPIAIFLANEPIEQANTAPTAHQPNPWAELSPRRALLSPCYTGVADAGTSSAPRITVGTILEYLRPSGHQCDNLRFETIIDCLRLINICPTTLFKAIEAAYDAHHPLLANLRVNGLERSELITRLAGIVTRKYMLKQMIKTIALNCQYNPEQLLRNFINHIRNSAV